MSKEAKILIAIAGVVILAGVLLAIFANPRPLDPGAPVDTDSIVREHNYMTGSLDAKVQMIEFADYQCPACAAAHPILKRLIAEYGDNPDFNFIFKNFPLDSIHPNARPAAEAAEAAGEQGKYWEMNDLLFVNQGQWASNPSPIDIFVDFAQQIGVANIDQFRQSISIRKYNEIISADVKDGESIGVSSTPTIYINGERMPNYQYELLRNKIEEILNQEEEEQLVDLSVEPTTEPEDSPEIN
ncbi:MAG TPA: thioredoxin domain-containing protein [Candidatus Doudnabacteria bacterium]|nr:thioredoxin domain-containing protein [Candidatus Doudnabacteria bacterium]